MLLVAHLLFSSEEILRSIAEEEGAVFPLGLALPIRFCIVAYDFLSLLETDGITLSNAYSKCFIVICNLDSNAGDCCEVLVLFCNLLSSRSTDNPASRNKAAQSAPL